MRVRNKVEPLSEYTPTNPHLASISPEDYPQLAAGLTDDQAIKKIGQRSSTSGKIITITMIVGAIALSWFYVQRSAKYESRMKGIDAAGQLQGAEMLAALRTELSNNEYDDVRVRAIRNLAHFKDKEAVPLFIKALETPGIVRRAAALGLAEIGSPAADAAKPALLASLPDTDEKDRPQVVWALAVLREPNATDAIIKEFTKGLLQHQPGFDPKIITEALGIAKLSSPELTGHDEKSVRTLVAVALSEAASPEVVDPLVRMLQRPNEDAEVIRAAVAGLGRAGDPRAAAPLFALMQEHPEMTQSVIDALGRSTAAPQLAVLLGEAKNVNTKRELVRLLDKTHDPRSADALASMLNEQDEDTRIEAAEALADLGDARALGPLLELAKSPDDTVGNDAVDALRTLGDPSVGPALMKLIGEFPHRKASLMRALGACGATDAGPMLVAELKGDDVGAAAKALGQLKDQKGYAAMAAMLKRDPKIDFSRPGVVTEMAYRNRLEAMTGLSYYQEPDPKVAEALMTIVEDELDDPRLRVMAGTTLGHIADDAILGAILAKISDTALNEDSRVAYVQGLWQKPNPGMSTKLMPLLSATDQPVTVRVSAALAIGYAANPANDDGLIALLDNAETRRYAEFAVALGGNVAGAEKLLEVLPKDREAEEILRTAVGSNADDNFNLLTEPMFKSGEVFRRMAVANRMREGNDDISYSYLWLHLATRLGSGWEGPGGVKPRYIRNALYTALSGQDAELRTLVAEMFGTMNERGLLLAARDAGIKEARQELLALDQPRVEK